MADEPWKAPQEGDVLTTADGREYRVKGTEESPRPRVCHATPDGLLRVWLVSPTWRQFCQCILKAGGTYSRG